MQAARGSVKAIPFARKAGFFGLNDTSMPNSGAVASTSAPSIWSEPYATQRCAARKNATYGRVYPAYRSS